MLNSREKYVMKYLYQKCMGKKNSLITPREVISFASDKFIMTTEDLDGIMRNLEYDNYIDLTRTDKKGEQVFIVGLKTKGEAFCAGHDPGKREQGHGHGHIEQQDSGYPRRRRSGSKAE